MLLLDNKCYSLKRRKGNKIKKRRNLWDLGGELLSEKATCKSND
jgi:hypothetical protein